MSIIIKDMEMPKNCDACWALDDYGDYPRCRITEEQRGYNFPVRERRMDNCPLVEIPTPHGRLIDADKLNIHDVSPAYGFCVMGVTEEDIELADTVIEGSETE